MYIIDTIAEYVKTLTADDIVCPNGQTLNHRLIDAAKDLVNNLRQGIQQFYADYSPKVYGLTGQLYNAVNIGDIGTVSIHFPTASLTVNIKKVMHPSLFGGSSVDVFWLMNDGYAVRSGRHKNIPYFGFRPGASYIERAVALTKAKYADIGLMVHVERK